MLSVNLRLINKCIHSYVRRFCHFSCTLGSGNRQQSESRIFKPIVNFSISTLLHLNHTLFLSSFTQTLKEILNKVLKTIFCGKKVGRMLSCTPTGLHQIIQTSQPASFLQILRAMTTFVFSTKLNMIQGKVRKVSSMLFYENMGHAQCNQRVR